MLVSPSMMIENVAEYNSPTWPWNPLASPSTLQGIEVCATVSARKLCFIISSVYLAVPRLVCLKDESWGVERPQTREEHHQDKKAGSTQCDKWQGSKEKLLHIGLDQQADSLTSIVWFWAHPAISGRLDSRKASWSSVVAWVRPSLPAWKLPSPKSLASWVHLRHS